MEGHNVFLWRSGLDTLFSKVQLKAVMGMFDAGWSNKHFKAFVNGSPAMQQQPATNIWKVADWRLGLAHDFYRKLMEEAGY